MRDAIACDLGFVTIVAGALALLHTRRQHGAVAYAFVSLAFLEVYSGCFVAQHPAAFAVAFAHGARTAAWTAVPAASSVVVICALPPRHVNLGLQLVAATAAALFFENWPPALHFT